MTERAGAVAIRARLAGSETLGDRIIKVNHAGEHGAVSIYAAQIRIARWRAPDMVADLTHFLGHERRHRALFAAELAARGRSRCRSFHLCALGGTLLGLITALIGHRAIAATTVAIERVVLEHLTRQLRALIAIDDRAAAIIRTIIADEQEHHDRSLSRIGAPSIVGRLIDGIVAASTETVIWLGMRL
jgi:ubiquinone biosynthesis monooxygenase Coq7